ncbi:MAG: hypothetical protein AB7V46_22965 [Thermomicrobiales bacterium]
MNLMIQDELDAVERKLHTLGTGVYYLTTASPVFTEILRIVNSREPSPYAIDAGFLVTEHAWHALPIAGDPRAPDPLQKHFVGPLDYQEALQLSELAIDWFFVPSELEAFAGLVALPCPDGSCDPSVVDACGRRGCRCQSDMRCR